MKRYLLYLTDIIFVLSVGLVHHLKQFDLDLGLIEKRFLVFDDFDSHMTLLLVIVCLDHLSKRSFADE